MATLAEVAPPAVLEGLFATITYRMEPEGRGSRFPLVMKRLYTGRLNASEVPAAIRELEEIEAGLAALPPERVVWSLSDLRRRDDNALPVNRTAANTRDYFVALDGRPLITALRASLVPGEAVHLRTPRSRQLRAGALGAVMLGLLWTAVGYLFFPNWIFTTVSESSQDAGGPLLWPAGIFFAGAGAIQLFMLRHQALEEWFEDHVWFSVLLILLASASYFLIAWRQ